MYMNAYHKVQGEVRMFEVDARNAIARFPAEWSAEPWPEAGVDDATAKKGRQKKAAEMAPDTSEVAKDEGEASDQTNA